MKVDAIPAKKPAIVSISGFGRVLMSVITKEGFRCYEGLFPIKDKVMSF